MKPYISSYIHEQSLNQETLQSHIKDQMLSFQLHSDKRLQSDFLLFVVVSLNNVSQKHCHPCQFSLKDRLTRRAAWVLKAQNEKRCANSQGEQRIQIKPTEDFLVPLSNATLFFIFLFFWSEIARYSVCWNKKTDLVFKLEQEQNNVTGRIKQRTAIKGHVSTNCERAFIFEYSIEKLSLNSPCHRIFHEISYWIM